VAERGLQAYAVPSARAGRTTDPSARRDALTGLLSGGFLLAIVAVILAIVVAAPEYAEPAHGSSDDGALAVTASASPATSEAPEITAPDPTTAPPNRLKGYRWPVKGGMVATYYDWDPDGRFIIDGKPMHGGLVITWFEGAIVKAAHSGKVVAVGPHWQDEVGYDEPLDAYYEKLRRKKLKPSLAVVIDDGNGYRSVYSELKVDPRVKIGDKVKAGTIIGTMSKAEGRQMMRYELVRMDGDWLKVAPRWRERGLPDYVREHVDPLAVLNVNANTKPRTDKRVPPDDPPRLSDY
jgi:murein DD-endopeptidase MepM/ murein hydrolase activator NlpD